MTEKTFKDIMERKDSNYKGSPIRLLVALQAETPKARRAKGRSQNTER